jgi:hypothetical protein
MKLISATQNRSCEKKGNEKKKTILVGYREPA